MYRHNTSKPFLLGPIFITLVVVIYYIVFVCLLLVIGTHNIPAILLQNIFSLLKLIL